MEQLKVRLVVTIVAVIVSLMATVTHDNILMLLGNENFVIRIVLDRERLALFVTCVTIEAGNIFLESGQISVGIADRRGVQKIRINQRMANDDVRLTPKIRHKRAGQGKEKQGDNDERPAGMEAAPVTIRGERWRIHTR